MILSFALRRKVLFAVILLFCWSRMTGQEPTARQGGCTGLHAGITAGPAIGFNPPSVMVGFLLLNDSDRELDVAHESWTLVINGKDWPRSDMLFGNGPQPGSGYKTLQAGASFRFSYALPTKYFFPEQRDYTIAWKGKGFTSPAITVRIPAELR